MDALRLGTLRARAGGARPGWATLVAVVVLGIIGMHALALHGSQHGDAGGLATPSEMPAMAGHNVPPTTNGHGHGAVTGGAVDASSGETLSARVVTPLEPERGMAGMAILCIAVLAGAALAWMLLRSRPSLHGYLRKRVTLSVCATRRTEARQNGPPPVWAFSVIRC